MEPPSLVDQLPDGVVVADGTGTVTAVNAAARRLLGETAEVGRTLGDVLALQDTDGAEWHPTNHPYATLPSVTGVPEQSWLTADGTEVLTTARINRERRGGPVTSVAVVVRSGRGRERLDRDRSDLVATVAHELRSPLTGVKGFVGTLLRRWESLNDDQKRLMLTTVHVDAERLTRLITELLDVARIDTGRLPLYPREVDARVIVERVVEAARTGTTRTLTLVVDDDVPSVHADPDKLTQVVANVVDNAIRHGDGEVSIRLAALATPYAGALLRVDDEGEGIEEAIRTRVFTKFWKHGVRGGTGLGMYIVGGLVRAHGGDIEIDDAPSGGARIEIRWPSDDRR
ncbi:PAS domain-containing sensor histidine kinase [Nocardioides aequoreus]|uniref:sensor histidine kinase n=1 Tax=Nocardioides aequoreus TaxID=397278 RepID=UPI0004C31C65|nr:PAS domain-containing sensor histidine kinase [Nocardioides aequoreus]